jgi:hypothetical protein
MPKKRGRSACHPALNLRNADRVMKNSKNLSVLDMSSSRIDRPLRTEVADPVALGAESRDYVDKMLHAALHEAQATVRSYDTKAQIVGVGYILALNLVLHFGDLLPTRAPLGPLFFAVVWGVIMMPILQFGQVLYPSRVRAEKELARKTCAGSAAPIYYVDPDSFEDLGDYVQQAQRADWTAVLGSELLKTSRARIIKQTRFRRGLMMTVVSFVTLGGEQFLRSLSIT